MKKSIILPIIASASLIVVSSTLAICAQSHMNLKANAETYSIVMNGTKNALTAANIGTTSGTAVIQTELGNNITFSYTSIKKYGTYDWQTLPKFTTGSASYSSFRNVDPIHGMSSITLVCDSATNNQIKICYSGNYNDHTTYENINISGSTPVVFDFNGAHPNYLYLENLSTENDLVIKSVGISLDCNNYYHNFSVESESVTKGTVSANDKAYLPGAEIGATATAKSGYVFDGWYFNNNLVTKDNPFRGTMPDYDYHLVAKFITQNEYYQAMGIIPVVNGSYVTYGMYPKNVITNTALLTTLNSLTTSNINSATGWYYYDNNYYAKCVAKPNNSSYSIYFDSGRSITTGNTYWFKCEPITWKIYNQSGNIYSLISDQFLDVHWYYVEQKNTRTVGGVTVYQNNYMYSDVRAFLNGLDGSSYNCGNFTGTDGFIKKAFGIRDSYLQTMTVDNSGATTHSSTNQYGCDTTYDKVTLPTVTEFGSIFYDVNVRKPNDWCKANGAYVDNYSYDGNGKAWSRTPYSGNAKQAEISEYTGSTSSAGVNDTRVCVRPIIQIKIS